MKLLVLTMRLTVCCLALTICASRAATIVVTNLAPSGPGTLHSALTNAHDGDTVTFAVTGIITNGVSTGLVISNNLSIVGPGPSLLAITGTNWWRAFRVNSEATTSISGLTFTNCYAGSSMNGGAIYNSGNLSLSNCLFTSCKSTSGGVSLNNGGPGMAAGNGGAIYNSGMLRVVNCRFLTNTAGAGGSGAGGSIDSSSTWTPGGNGGNGGSGGGIYDVGTASFLNCIFGWNAAGRGGAGGGGASGYWSPLSRQHTAGPGAPGGAGGDGGNGSAVFSLGGATFVNCTFFGNASGAGGAGGNGGAGYLYNNPGAQGGTGGNAGSSTLYCTGAVQLIACTFAANSSGRGGNGGSGGAGGNNTFNGPGGNGGNGGSSGNGGNGGGILGLTANGVSTLRNVLVAQNLAGSAGAAGGGGAGGTGIFSGPSGSAGANGTAGTGPDLYGNFVSQGHNLIGLQTGNSGFTNNLLGDIVGTNATINAKLGTLTNNSGWVWTCALQNGSPALDAGDDSITGSPLNLANDARGYPRQSGSHVDIGAYEHQWAITPVILNSAVVADGIQLAVTNTPGAYLTVIAASSLSTPPASWAVLGVMSETSPGLFTWTDPSYTNRSSRFFRLRNP